MNWRTCRTRAERENLWLLGEPAEHGTEKRVAPGALDCDADV
jgi:hypothetical protein